MIRKRSILTLAGLILALGVAGGCQKQLFSNDLPRSPYERYGALRGVHRPATEQDAFGADLPALRARLRPLEQP
jgi:hypothetical protein